MCGCQYCSVSRLAVELCQPDLVLVCIDVRPRDRWCTVDRGLCLERWTGDDWLGNGEGLAGTPVTSVAVHVDRSGPHTIESFRQRIRWLINCQLSPRNQRRGRIDRTCVDWNAQVGLVRRIERRDPDLIGGSIRDGRKRELGCCVKDQ